MQAAQNMEVTRLIQLYQGIYPLSYIVFDPNWNVLTRMEVFDYDFITLIRSELKAVIDEHLATGNKMPFVIQDIFELTWSGVPEYQDDVLKAIHMLGPVFFDNISLSNVQTTLSRHYIPVNVKHRLIDTMRRLPVIYSISFMDYTRMLYQCITQKRINANQIAMLSTASIAKVSDSNSFRTVSQHGTWELEQRICQNVEQGNLDYMKDMANVSNIGRTGILSTTSSFRQDLYLTLTQIALVSRAAIRGGLPAETSYSLSDKYIQMLDQATSISEIKDISFRVMDDFIHRVHECRTQSDISDPIRQCADYISLHYAEDLNTEELASMIGYSGNYLSKKFKEEMHITLVQYITRTRIHHAVDMLRDHSLSIADISDSLGFTSQSYFGVQFRKYTGTTPGEFRRSGHLPNKSEFQ